MGTKTKSQLIFLLTWCIAANISVNAKNHNIVWNSQLMAPQIKATTLKVRMNDQLSLRCPGMGGHDEYYEYVKLYMVSKREWETCMLIKPKWLGICNNSSLDTTIKLTFREFSPVPNGLEFKMGELYYIISTSSGRKAGINQSAFGLCKRENLKLKVLVLARDHVPSQTPPTTTLSYYEEYEDWHANDQVMTYQIHYIGELEANTSQRRFGFISTVCLLTYLLLQVA